MQETQQLRRFIHIILFAGMIASINMLTMSCGKDDKKDKQTQPNPPPGMGESPSLHGQQGDGGVQGKSSDDEAEGANSNNKPDKSPADEGNKPAKEQLVGPEVPQLTPEELAEQKQLDALFTESVELHGPMELLSDCNDTMPMVKECNFSPVPSVIADDKLLIPAEYRNNPQARLILDLDFVDIDSGYSVLMNGTSMEISSIQGKRSFPLLYGENNEITLNIKANYSGRQSIYRHVRATIKSIRLYLPKEAVKSNKPEEDTTDPKTTIGPK